MPKPANKRRALDVGGLPKSKDDAECDVELLELDMKGECSMPCIGPSWNVGQNDLDDSPFPLPSIMSLAF